MARAPLLVARELGPLPSAFRPCADTATVVDQEVRDANDAVAQPHLSWDVDDVRPCLDSIKTDLHTMILTLENLFFGVTTIYSFTTIATDAAASVQRNRCGLDVHDLKVDLYRELALIWEELVEPSARQAGLEQAASMTAEEILHALESPTRVSALSFHSRLNALFSSLRDAHTRYSVGFQVPVLQILPLEFELEAEPIGEPHTPRVLARRVASDHAAAAFKEVVSINSANPHEFLSQISDRRGLYLDDGQRINALLLGGDGLGDPQGAQGLQLRVGNECDLVAPNQSTVHVGFADGSSLETKWRVQLEPTATVDAFRNKSTDFETLQQMELDKLLLRDRQMAECLSIRGCDPDIVHELVPQRPEGLQAIRAYRRLFRDWLSEEALARVAVLSASKAKARLEKAAQERSPALSARASGALGSAWTKSGELLAEPMPAGSPPAPRLRGAAPERQEAGGDVAAAQEAATALDAANQQWPRSAPNASEQRARNETGQIQECLARGSNASDDVEVLFAPTHGSMVVMRLGEMVVIKMTDFLELSDGMEGYRIAVDHARQRGIERLLFDLVGNGGGLVQLSDLFVSLILKRYTTQELCPDFTEKINAYWREWILSFGIGIDALIRRFVEHLRLRATRVPLRVGKWMARWHLRHLRIIIRAFDRILEPFGAAGSLDASLLVHRIGRWIWRVERTTSRGDLLRFMERIMLRQAFLPSFVTSRLPSDSGDASDTFGWFPITGYTVLNRTSFQPFPNLTGLLEPVRQRWGDGRASGQQYSQKGAFFSCFLGVASEAILGVLAGLGNPDLREYRDHPFTDVAILSDGLAGSAASDFHSRLAASGFVTVFAYGGAGKAMDASAFAGGTLQSYEGWWQQAAAAAEMGMWLVPGSSWERLSRNLSLTSDLTGGESVIYPRPMPLEAASVSFVADMMYVREFDVEGDHTQLPRQFYRLPAHKHYSVWPRRLRNTCGNPGGLLEMYARIQQEDWWQVRSNPQYLDAGWSSECVPDERHRHCCEVRGGPDEL